MYKWLMVVMAATALVGCGGSGGGNGGGGVIPQGRSVPTINLGPNALVQTVFLTGAGRAIGSPIAQIDTVQYQDTNGNYIPSDYPATQQLLLQLDAYNINTHSITVGFNGETSKYFTEFPFQVARLYNFGDPPDDGPAVPDIIVDPPFDVQLRLFQGRQSVVQVKLDDQMLTNGMEGATLDYDLFTAVNYNPLIDAIHGFLSDYVAFDITNIPLENRPELQSNGLPAERVFFSGDGIAISTGVGETSSFELLDPLLIKNGIINEGVPIGGNQIGPNTYQLEDDPNLHLQTSLVGVWKDRKSVIIGTDTFTMVAFPTSLDNNGEESNVQQILLYQEDEINGNIIQMWHGTVEYGLDGDETRGSFVLFPLESLATGVPTDTVSGEVSNLVIVNGVVRSGHWDITSSVPDDFPFPLLGGFAVFRR